MSEATTVALPQDKDTPARLEEVSLGTLLLVSRRSQEARDGKLPNEDFVAYRHDAARFAAAVCDGVGQSFFGQIAARFLGERLLDWLWELPPDAVGDGTKQAERLFNDLHAWTEAATRAVKAHPLPKDEADSLRLKVLERKREEGSSTVFACARIDRAADDASCIAFWLGNTRLRFWDAGGKEVSLTTPHATREQWSTAKGPLNSDVVHHVALPSLAEKNVRRLTAHTDGFHQFADSLGGITKTKLEKILRELAEDPASDDISLLDVKLKLK